MIELGMSTASWISSLIDNITLHFSNTTLIGKIISLSGNFFIFFTTVKMLLISFISQTLLLLNPILILVQFLAVNAMTLAQILPKTSPRFSKHWNLNKVSVKSWQGFCEILTRFLLLWWGTAPTRSCSDWSCPHLALPCLSLPHLTLPHLAPPHLAAYPILKSLIMPHHIKMCLVLWQLTIWYGYLAHLNQLSSSFPILSCLVQPLSCPALFHHCLVWSYSFTGAQPSRGGATVMVPSHMLRNLVEAPI